MPEVTRVMSSSCPCTEGTIKAIAGRPGPQAWLARRVQALKLPAGALRKKSSKTLSSVA